METIFDKASEKAVDFSDCGRFITRICLKITDLR